MSTQPATTSGAHRGRLLPYLAWALLGLAYAASLWFVYAIPGAVGLFVCIGASFLLWYRMTPRGSWLALVMLGAVMGSVLTVQAVTGSRCPPAGTTVILKAGKPPVSCDEIRTSSGAMAVFFTLLAVAGLLAPIQLRRLDAMDREAEQAGARHT